MFLDLSVLLLNHVLMLKSHMSQVIEVLRQEKTKQSITHLPKTDDFEKESE